MSVVILRGDAACLPLPDASVDLVVTSPPYWALRSYSDNGEHYAGQIGSEPTPREYVDALLACTREWMRVLKPEGSLFVNLGDKYAGGQPHSDHGTGASTLNGHGGEGTAKDRAGKFRRTVEFGGYRPKSLLGLPWRYALGCIDDLGLILRAEVIWDKPNGLPESVTDRVRRSHEQVFHFTRSPRYYSAVDEVREAHAATLTGRNTNGWRQGPSGQNRGTAAGRTHDNGDPFRDFATSPLGKLPGSVWQIPSAPLAVPAHLGVDHFAAYPPALVRRIVLGWSPAAVCTACGEGRRPVSDVTRVRHYAGGSKGTRNGIRRAEDAEPRMNPVYTITGYACACPQPDAPARPGLVVDPFGGTGTTALVASVFGRTGVSVDRSADYCRLAAWRTADPGQRAKAAGKPKPKPAPQAGGTLFDTGDVALTAPPDWHLEHGRRGLMPSRSCPDCRYPLSECSCVPEDEEPGAAEPDADLPDGDPEQGD